MAQYDIKLDANELVGLLSDNDKFSSLMESIINQVLDAQMTEHLGAENYERNDDRTGYRNGYRLRQLYTRIGHLTLRVPQTRDGSFSTEIFERYRRSEQAFVLGLMEMYLCGVSTRKVKKVTEALCGVSFSKSTVSDLTTELNAKVDAFKNRRLDDKKFPFVIVDALVIDVRKDHIVRSMSILIAYGVNEFGQREILGLWLGDSESETTWEKLFKELKSRGLSNVDLVVSDNHAGLVNALKKQFQGAAWQRCQVHFMRNILGHASIKDRKEIAAHLKTILHAHDIETAKRLSNRFINEFEKKAKNAANCFEEGIDAALTVLHFPPEYRCRLRTTNLAERVNEEIRRRQRVIRIFPNEASAIRIVGALLADIHDDWITGCKYFDMTHYWEWKKNADKNKKSNCNGIIELTA